MIRSGFWFPLAATLAAAIQLAACSNSLARSSASAVLPRAGSGSSGSGYISHVVLVIQENRSFDDFFATFPGADGTTYGCMYSTMGSAKRRPRHESGSGYCPSSDTYVPLAKVNLAEQCDFGHSYRAVAIDYDNGLMDGFANEGDSHRCPGKAGVAVYQYVDPTQIAPYWEIAEQYVLADHMFQTQGSGSFTAHQDLIRGGTCFKNCPAPYMRAKSLVDFPTSAPWGCDGPPGDKTSVLTWTGTKLRFSYHNGPKPCMKYKTLADLFEAQSPQISWKYYAAPEPRGDGRLWNAFDAIEDIRSDPTQWKAHIAQNPNKFLIDISNNALPAMSWVTPDSENSDHPHHGDDDGPSWVASIVNAIGESPYWNSTAIIIVWDDWGGFYDHVPPPFFDDFGGLGFRVPMMIVSPYAREAIASQPGYISETPYEFGSIIKFIEGVWNLPSLGTTDQRATSIIDCFDFTQSPRQFTEISAPEPERYFLRQKPSDQPVDTE
jgi:phospholipase C